jgi:AcrR family transcriptional regulator
MEEKISRRERKKIHSKRVILEAAVKCFGRKGFQETSIAEIMNEADLGIGTFYNYFESKEDILKCLLSGIVDELREALARQTGQQAPAAEMLQHMVLLTAKLLDANRFVLPLFLSAANRSALPDGGTHPGEAPAFKTIFARIIEQGQAAGEFRTDIPAGIITEMFHSMFQAASFSSLELSFVDNVRFKLRLMMDGICTTTRIGE